MEKELFSTEKLPSLKEFRAALLDYNNSIQCSTDYCCLSDNRPERNKSLSAVVEFGYVATITVPESYSLQVYNHYASIALSFCDKLLTHHEALLRKITAGIVRTTPSTCSDHFYFLDSLFVSLGSVRDDSDLEFYPDCQRLFSDYGMMPLESVQQCYGFALALRKIYEPIWSRYGDLQLKITIEHCYYNGEDHFTAIKLQYEVEKKLDRPILQSW